MLDDLVTQMMQSECKDIPERLTEGKKKKHFYNYTQVQYALSQSLFMY